VTASFFTQYKLLTILEFKHFQRSRKLKLSGTKSVFKEFFVFRALKNGKKLSRTFTDLAVICQIITHASVVTGMVHLSSQTKATGRILNTFQGPNYKKI